ncbi:patatin-like phospholipase family protein [Streptomyces sp. NPDC006333]|uniref:patatin-like phospholipase family protein n=1 Tax=Streptomyces sp. NPDC006333 TaxID=3156753 RepID=UPI0033A072B8
MSTPRTGRPAIARFQVPREDGVPPTPSTAESASPDVVAFVRQGSGSRGAAQVGALRALTRAGITPALLTGSSGGALNGVTFATDPSIEGIDRLEAPWLNIKRRHVAPISVRTPVMAVVGHGEAAVSSAGVGKLLRLGFGGLVRKVGGHATGSSNRPGPVTPSGRAEHSRNRPGQTAQVPTRSFPLGSPP